MDLFYGSAGCSTCHSGQFQTDHRFHAIAMPQIGPGKAARFESHHRDVGRMRVTGDAADAYRFRTPSLRNVDQTAPYGHAGAFASLESVVRHHLDPVASLKDYDPSQAVLPGLVRARKISWRRPTLSKLKRLPRPTNSPQWRSPTARSTASSHFLHHLTDRRSPAFRLGTPTSVPSGLPVEQ